MNPTDSGGEKLSDIGQPQSTSVVM
jgi:hypothetical protein